MGVGHAFLALDGCEWIGCYAFRKRGGLFVDFVEQVG